jgi:hypothetical protein
MDISASCGFYSIACSLLTLAKRLADLKRFPAQDNGLGVGFHTSISGSLAHENALAARAISGPVGFSIHLVLVKKNRASDLTDLLYIHGFPVRNPDDFNVLVIRVTFSAELFDNLQYLHAVHKNLLAGTRSSFFYKPTHVFLVSVEGSGLSCGSLASLSERAYAVLWIIVFWV